MAAMKHIGGPARSGEEIEADRQATQARIRAALGRGRRTRPIPARCEDCGGLPKGDAGTPWCFCDD